MATDHTTKKVEPGFKTQFLNREDYEFDTLTLAEKPFAIFCYNGGREAARNLAANITQHIACSWHKDEDETVQFFAGDASTGDQLYEVCPGDIVVFGRVEEIEGISIFMIDEDQYEELVEWMEEPEDPKAAMLQDLFEFLEKIFAEEECEDCDDVDCPNHPDYKED